MVFFFFQAEDGIRDDLVTGVQTCALPIFRARPAGRAFQYRAGVHPNVCLNAAMNALTLEYPVSNAASVTDFPSASSRIESSIRTFCLQRPKLSPVCWLNSRSSVRRPTP